MGITITETRVQDQSNSALNIKDIINIVYPVGSIYMSVNDTNPSILFHGTWERIKDRFLLAAGDTYSAGSTGGEAQHTLTVSEMPAHRHQGLDIDGVYVFGWDTGDKAGYDFQRLHPSIDKTSERLETLSTGGSKPHNNMPPYLTVYVWKRVA